jgi:hypothetical protein
MTRRLPAPTRGLGSITTLLMLVLVWSAGCAAPGPGSSGDSRFGHRVAGDQGGRETMLLRPPADSVGYLTFPASIDSVAVRPAERAVRAGASVTVDVLIKGALPDACAELDAVEQRRGGRQVEMTLTMRQPRGAVCAQVVRPYRFYSVLPGLFEPGSYTLTLNGRVHTFQIHEARGEAP